MHLPPRSALLLVHGLGSTPLLLTPLAKRLRRKGYRHVVNWSYPSILRTICDHGDALRRKIEEVAAREDVDHVHLVTHSMGGILARRALGDRPQIDKLERLVMLCPPNGGSRVATNMSYVVGPLCTPLAQLSHTPDSYVNRLPAELPYEVGVVAARRDRVVAVDRTHLPCQRDHIVLPAGHTSILFTRRLAESVERFLLQGRFQAESTTVTRPRQDTSSLSEALL